MTKIDNDWGVHTRDDTDHYWLHHLKCIEKRYSGYTCSVEFLTEQNSNVDAYCKDCKQILPVDVFDKIKFIYANRSSR